MAQLIKEIKAGTERGPVVVSQNFEILGPGGTVIKPIPPPMPEKKRRTEPVEDAPKIPKRKAKAKTDEV